MGTREAIFGRPTHPYTQLLLQSVPSMDPSKRNIQTANRVRSVQASVFDMDSRTEPAKYHELSKDHKVLVNDIGEFKGAYWV